ncbi:MAG TPA: ComF family protein [Pirellulales bacterium]|nr:ComF family protein [Pirellulales bacterium]
MAKQESLTPWRRWRSIVAQVPRRWIDLVFPLRCASCDADMSGAAEPVAICQVCRQRLLADAAPRCPRCGERLALPELEVCSNCSDHPTAFERVWTLGDYAQELRSLVLRMKHSHEAPLTAAIGDLLFGRIGASLAAWRADAILPVPMHWLRRALRGSNSAELLGESLARRLAVPNAAGCLVRRRHTQPQSGLSPGARLANVRGAFRLRKGADFRETRVLLIDDILTTGATCGEIARVLRRSGAAAVSVAVVARASGNDSRLR